MSDQHSNIEFLAVAAEVLPDDTQHEPEQAYAYIENLMSSKRLQQNNLDHSFYESIFQALRKGQSVGQTLYRLGYACAESEEKLLQKFVNWLSAPVPALEQAGAAPEAELDTETFVKPTVEPSTEPASPLHEALLPASFLSQWDNRIAAGATPELVIDRNGPDALGIRTRWLRLKDPRQRFAFNLLALLRGQEPVTYQEMYRLGFTDLTDSREAGVLFSELKRQLNQWSRTNLLSRVKKGEVWAYSLRPIIAWREVGQPAFFDVEALQTIGRSVLNIATTFTRSSSPVPFRLPQARSSASSNTSISVKATEEPKESTAFELKDEKWMERAHCRQSDTETFFRNGNCTREAKQVCQGCEVRAECLEFALATDQPYGIWGGLSKAERRKLKKQGSPL